MAKIGLFKNATDTTDLGAGEIVFKEGDAGDAAYVVVEGAVEVMRDGTVIETLGEGGLFGELALIDDAPRAATVVARGPVRLAALDRKRFTRLIQDHPTFALHVMQIMADRLRGIERPD